MTRTIEIKAGSIALKAELNDSPTARKIWQALPIEGTATRWGDEIYFEIPVVVEQDPEARMDVQVGELGYWPMGRAFCIFFGPTPVSEGDEPRAYSPVNILGRVLGDSALFKGISTGEKVYLERA